MCCALVDGSIKKFPLARIEVDTPYFTGVVEAMCMENHNPRPDHREPARSYDRGESYLAEEGVDSSSGNDEGSRTKGEETYQAIEGCRHRSGRGQRGPAESSAEGR